MASGCVRLFVFPNCRSETKLTLRTAFYWAVTAAGSNILLVAVPFVVQGTTKNWRTNYWFWAGFSTFSLILSIFCLPETLFPRAPALIDGKIIITDQYGNVTVVAAEEASGLSPNQLAPRDQITASNSYIRALAPVKFQPQGPKKFLVTYIEMGLALLNPSIFWVLLLNSLLFGGLVSLSLTYSTQLESPPWSFSPSAVGTAQAGSFIGAIIALGLSGATVDRVSGFLTKHNDGVREPEHLIPNFVLPSCLAFAGLVLYGFVGGNPQKYPGSGWIGVHISFAMYNCGFVSLSAITGAWVAEATPHWSGAAMVLVCGGRNVLSFAIRYAFFMYSFVFDISDIFFFSNDFPRWIVSQGIQNAYIELGAALLGVMVVGSIPMYLFNKSIRRVWTKKLRHNFV